MLFDVEKAHEPRSRRWREAAIGLLFISALAWTSVDVKWWYRAVALACGIFGAYCGYRSRQHDALAKKEAQERLGRAPIVYLRPFRNDPSIFRGMWRIFRSRNPDTATSDEDDLASAVESYGPLVAIGKPGEGLPTPGAWRTAARESDWHGIVDLWLSSALLVIVSPGLSDGLCWELERVVSMVDPRRVVIYLKRESRKDYERFASLMRNRFSVDLPPFDSLTLNGNPSGFIEFGPAWRPSALPQIIFLKGRGDRTTRDRLYESPRPVFNRLGVEPQPWWEAASSDTKFR